MRFFIVILLLNQISPRCTEGCLKCIKGACTYCDLQSGYRLVQGKCEKYQLENCQFFNNFGSCMTCYDGFHLDFATKKCIKILEEDLIENCQNYSSPTTCSNCQTGFFLGAGKCEKIANPIENCIKQNSMGMCLLCDKGFVTSVDQKQCETVNQIEECATYTNLRCKQCSSEYLYNKNEYINHVFSVFTISQQEEFIQRDINLKAGYVDSRLYNNCIEKQISSCLVYNDFNSCRTCFGGYFLTREGLCEKYPLDRIDNCERYVSLTKCLQCEQGYQNIDNLCQPVKLIDNCQLYSPFTGNCTQCIESYFLVGYNNCIQRTKEIENCQVMDPEKEICKICQNNYRQTDDHSKCLPIVNDCQVYQQSNYISTKLECKICNEGFYYKINEQFCSKGEKENCQIYERTDNQCLKCLNKFYLERGNCLPHDVVPGCDVYHPVIKNACYECNYNTFNFYKVNSCVEVEAIENCDEYDKPNLCRKCIDGYYLEDNNCLMIPVKENCLQRNKTQCSKCLKDFVLQDGFCTGPLDFIVNECKLNNVDGFTDYKRTECFYCKLDRVPFDYKDTYVCVENDYMKYIQNQQEIDPNCLQYKEDKYHKFTCEKCIFGMVVDDGECKTECPNNKTLYKQKLSPYNRDANRVNESFSIEQVNVCGSLIENCKVAAPDLYQEHQSIVTYSCIECRENKFSEIEFGKRTVLIRDITEELDQYGKSPLSYEPAKKCLDLSNNYILGDVNPNTNMIDNCQYYIDVGLTKGCAKCNQGYSGVVLNVVNQCEIYDQNQFTCKQCHQGFYKSSVYECKAVIEIINCKTYSQTSNVSECIECDPEYYVTDNKQKCTRRLKSKDKQNCTLQNFSDDCQCNDGFFNFNENQGTIYCVQKPNHCINAFNDNGVANCSLCDQSTSYRVPEGNGYKCIAGGISNCVNYKIDQSFCLECAEGFYLNEGNCIAHLTLENCKSREKQLKNTCDTCNVGYIKFEYETRCVNIEKIENCQQYDTTETCLKCEDGYRLENIRKRCIRIPDSLNCLIQTPVNIYDTIEQDTGYIDTYDAQDLTEFIYTCDKCKVGYYRQLKTVNFVTNTQVEINGALKTHPQNNQPVNDVYECKSYFNTYLEDCDTHNVDGLIDHTTKPFCNICNAGFLPEIISDDRYICMDREYISTKAPTNISFDNCNRVDYNHTLLKYECIQCLNGFYLENGDCVDTCTTHDKHVGIFSQVGGYSVLQKYGECVDATAYTVANCDIYSTDSQTLDNDPVCVKCKDGFIPVIEFDTYANRKSTKYNIYNNEFNHLNPVNQYPTIKTCDNVDLNVATNHINGNLLGTSSVPNCKYYTKEVDGAETYYSCVTCELGRSGEVKEMTTAGGGNVVLGYIDSCVVISGCALGNDLHELNKPENAGNIVYEMYESDQPYWNKLFTCFKCTNSYEIPVLHAKFDASLFTNYESYGIRTNGNADNFNVLTGEPAVACRPFFNADGTQITADPAGGATDKFEFANLAANNPLLPLNCALAVINTNTDGDVTTLGSVDTGGGNWQAPIGCVACNPGYAPSRNFPSTTAIYNPIDLCVQIENCTTAGNWFNGCEECIHFVDYSVIATELFIDFTRCVKPRPGITLQNCYAAYYSGPCQICQPGYQKDSSGICKQVKAPNCSSYSLQKNSYQVYEGNGIKGSSPAIPYLLFNEKYYGCQECDDNDNITVKVNLIQDERDPLVNEYMCTQNDYNLNEVTIENCFKYGWDLTNSKMICKQCNIGTHILTVNNQCTPLDNSTLSNCLIANEMNGTTCMECETNYLNVAGTCISLASNPISNCKEYNESLSKENPFPYCVSCNDGYYLSDDNTECIQIPLANCAEWSTQTRTNSGNQTITKKWCTKCMSNYILIEKKNEEQYCYQVNVSTNDDNQDKCIEWDPLSFTKRKLKCKQCLIDNTNTYIVADTDVLISTQCQQITQHQQANCSKYDVNVSTGTNEFDTNHVGSFFNNSFKCQECETSNNADDPYSIHYYDFSTSSCVARTAVTNCKKHFQYKNECQECVDNFVLKNNTCVSIKAVNQNPINKGYIQSCNQLTECEQKVVYDGAHLHLRSLLSCHKCSSSTEIPFIGLRVKQDTFMIQSLQEYGLTTAKFYEGNGDKSVQCLEPINTTFNLQTSDFNFPDQCGIGVINAHSNKNARDSKLASLPNALNTYEIGIYCGACKPGFKATKTQRNGADFAYMVSECTAIQNCYSSQWFNNCSQCLPKHSYKYTENGVKYDECIQFEENPNCHALEIVNNIKKCKFCKQGYVLNVDGYCEALTAPRCSQFRFSYRQYHHKNYLNTGLILQGDGLGCQKCDDGFVGFYKNKTTLACTASPYHTDGLVQSSSNYIYNCQNYKVYEGQFKCHKCKENSVLTINGKCVPDTDIPNCILANDAQRCRKCNKGFVVIDKLCVAETISNCQQFGYDDQSFRQTCLKCNDGFYMEQNQCFQGQTKECKQYKRKGICKQCKDGFGLVLTEDNKRYCYPISEKQHCEKVDTILKYGQFKCKKCSDNNHVKTFNRELFQPSSCMIFQIIENCELYKKDIYLDDSEFKCERCKEDYYLKDNECLARVYENDLCKEFSLTEDICLECKEGYFLESNGCYLYPDGVRNCNSYLSKDECQVCKPGYYIKKGKCVQQQKEIDNCSLYDDKYTCQVCNDGFIQVEGYCYSVEAQGCASYESIFACSSCADGKGFKLSEDGKLLNCVDKGITSCLESEDYEPYKCLTCETNFYPNEGVCTQTSVQIENCKTYSGNDLCSVCNQGTVLSKDKKLCLSTPEVVSKLDENCSVNEVAEEPICSTCKNGYFFIHGFCTQCAKNTLTDGCQQCDPRDQNNCLLCTSGFYQHNDGTCIRNGELPPEKEDESNGTDSNGTDNDNNTDSSDNQTDTTDDKSDEDKTEGYVRISQIFASILLIYLCQL